MIGDHLGSTSVVANHDGTLYARQGYKAWGEQRFPAGASSLPTTFRFTGQREEASLGLYFYGARWYDPALGRFTQADTVIPNLYNSLDWDRYAYVHNNPVNYIDPSGYKPCDGRDAGMRGGCTPENDPFTRQELEDALKYEYGLKDLPLGELKQSTLQGLYDYLGRFDVNTDFSYTDNPDLNWLEDFLSWRSAPLFFASLQVVSSDAYYLLGATLLAGSVGAPELSPALADIALNSYLALFALNRISAIGGLAATLYQYKNGLYGTTGLDVAVSATTFLTGWAPFPSNVNICSAHVSFAYTFYRWIGGPLP